jgi:hypothetical protein
MEGSGSFGSNTLGTLLITKGNASIRKAACNKVLNAQTSDRRNLLCRIKAWLMAAFVDAVYGVVCQTNLLSNPLLSAEGHTVDVILKGSSCVHCEHKYEHILVFCQ